jgi:oxygen-independent coproporphyrinogen-3 oxidase
MNGLKSTFFMALRTLMSGEGRKTFVFQPPQEKTVRGLGSTNLYLHVPFCRNRCYYCPYNTVPFAPEKVGAFFSALRVELSLYKSYGKFVAGNTLYIGGGTPGCCGDALFDFIAYLKKNAGEPREIAIEINPEEITSGFVNQLKASGITQVSLGVQSFHDNILRYVGRTYQASVLPERIRLLKDAAFDNLNIDLMFAFQGQTEAAFRQDLEFAIASGASQITAYPFFDFPHAHAKNGPSSIGMPALRQRRKMYHVLWQTMLEHDFEMVSVWGFRKKNGRTSFSSVSRDNFIGLGPGSASKLPDIFRFNTFTLDAYLADCQLGQSACSLEMPLSENLETLYRLYWRFYEGKVPGLILQSGLKRKRLWHFVSWCLRLTGFMKYNQADGAYVLTERGAFWIHLLQNYYILNYIDRVWTTSKAVATPPKIEL